MDLRCIALDLDGTALNRESRLSEANRRALEDAICRGVSVVLASGRAFSTLPRDVFEVAGIEYAVTSNGAAVCRMPDGQVLMRRCLPRDCAARILSLSQGADVTYEAFVDGVAYADAGYMAAPLAFGATPESIEYLFTTRHAAADIRSFLLEHADRLDSVDVICWDRAHMAELKQKFTTQLPEVYMTSSSHQRLEFSHPETGKQSGVSWVLERLGLQPCQLAAFGDGDNDADMLRYAGCGIAMANATPTCRAAADFVTGANGDDGVADAIRQILQVTAAH